MTSPNALAAALRALPGFAALRPADLQRYATKGIAHDHWRIADRGLLVRVPNAGQFAIPPQDYIPYQEASFTRAQPSGHVPRLVAAVQPSAELPMGALVIEEIAGRPPRMPQELPLIAECLARLHSLPVPHPAERPPLVDHADPVAGTIGFIAKQATFLDKAAIIGAARAMIMDEIAWAIRFGAESAGKDQPVTLVATDTHPGNYLVDASGKAMLVDVEKMLYGSPAIDLAHATLYTSTTWDVDCGTALARGDIVAFYRDYLSRIDATLAARLQPWLLPLRRLTWLRTTTWACRYLVETLYRGKAGDPAAPYARHVRARIDDFLDERTIAAVRQEWLGDQPLDLGR